MFSFGNFRNGKYLFAENHHYDIKWIVINVSSMNLKQL